MRLEDVFSVFSLFSAVLGVKIFLLTFIFFYVILALVTLRQTQLMSQILNETKFSPFLKTSASVHLAAAVIIFVLALILFLF